MKLKNVFTVLWTLIAATLGAFLGMGAFHIAERITEAAAVRMPDWTSQVFAFAGLLILGVLGIFSAKHALVRFLAVLNRMKKAPFWQTVSTILGLTAGLILAYLLTRVVQITGNAWFAFLVSVLLYIILGYAGITLALNHQDGIRSLLTGLRRRYRRTDDGKNTLLDEEMDGGEAAVKVLDSSVLIDGRVLAVARTGFLEGTLVVPQFVLTELHHLSDSADELKRNRGRRGLDMLHQLQNLPGDRVQITKQDIPQTEETDAKLITLTQRLGGVLMTHDYNLSKVAKVQGVGVLNIHDLANAVKSEALPGETLQIQVVKPGNQSGQGVGYLPDGTMVVIENGQELVGKLVPVTVTSALQTSAGRMIFAKTIGE